MDLFRDIVRAPGDLAAHAVDMPVVFIHEIDAEVVELVTGGPPVPTTEPDRFHRMTGHEPVGDIDVVDVLFDDVVAAYPSVEVPSAALAFHFFANLLLGVGSVGFLIFSS